MNSTDYPPFYQDASHAAGESQSDFFNKLRWSLIFLVLTAGVALGRFPTPHVAVLQLIFLLGSLGLTIYLAYKQPQRIWYGTRALAESIKTVTWRFMMKAEPYDVPAAEARTRFTKTIKEIVADNKFSGHVVATSAQPQITLEMERKRAQTLPERKKTYEEERISDQHTWYVQKATENRRLSSRWFAGLIAIHALAIASAIANVAKPTFQLWPTDLLVAAAAACMAWVQTKRFQELSAMYSLTAHEIGALRTSLQSIRSEKAFSQFVADAENAFSREHTQWRAKRDME